MLTFLPFLEKLLIVWERIVLNENRFVVEKILSYSFGAYRFRDVFIGINIFLRFFDAKNLISIRTHSNSRVIAGEYFPFSEDAAFVLIDSPDDYRVLARAFCSDITFKEIVNTFGQWFPEHLVFDDSGWDDDEDVKFYFLFFYTVEVNISNNEGVFLCECDRHEWFTNSLCIVGMWRFVRCS